MSTTLLSNMLNPQVLGDMVSYELENRLQLTGLYRVDTTLVGRPGNTITLPEWLYVGMAEELAENEQVQLREMNFKDQQFTIKKAAQGVQLTDEAMLSGYGDPPGEAARQLALSIADRVEQDGVMSLEAIFTDTRPNVQVFPLNTAIEYAGLIEAQDMFMSEIQGETMYLVVSRAGAKQIRLDPKFIELAAMAGQNIQASGVIGTFAGCRVVISNRVQPGNAFIMRPQALFIWMKRGVMVETQRDITFFRNTITASQHYVVGVPDVKKVIAITHTAPAAGAVGAIAPLAAAVETKATTKKA